MRPLASSVERRQREKYVKNAYHRRFLLDAEGTSTEMHMRQKLREYRRGSDANSSDQYIRDAVKYGHRQSYDLLQSGYPPQVSCDPYEKAPKHRGLDDLRTGCHHIGNRYEQTDDVRVSRDGGAYIQRYYGEEMAEQTRRLGTH